MITGEYVNYGNTIPGFFFNLHPVFDVDENVTCYFDVSTGNLTSIVIALKPFDDHTNIPVKNLSVRFSVTKRVNDQWVTNYTGYSLNDERMYTATWINGSDAGKDDCLDSGETLVLNLTAPKHAVLPYVTGPTIRACIYDNLSSDGQTFWDITLFPAAQLKPVLNLSFEKKMANPRVNGKADASDPIMGIWQAESNDTAFSRFIINPNYTFVVMSDVKGSYVETDNGTWQHASSEGYYLLRLNAKLIPWCGSYELCGSLPWMFNCTGDRLISEDCYNMSTMRAWRKVQ